MKRLFVCITLLIAGSAAAQFLPDARIAAKKRIAFCVVDGSFEGDSLITTDTLYLEQLRWVKAADRNKTENKSGIRDSLGRLICRCTVPPPKHCHNDTTGTSYFYGANGKLRKAISHSCEKGDCSRYYFYDANDSLNEVRYDVQGSIPVTLEKYYRNAKGKLDSVIYYWTVSPAHPETDSSIQRVATIHHYDTNGDGLSDKIMVFDPFCSIAGNENCGPAVYKPFIYRFRYEPKR